jgi:hypothetical protein
VTRRSVLYAAFIWAIFLIFASLLSIPIGHLVPGGAVQIVIAAFLIVVLLSFFRAAIAMTQALVTGVYERDRALPRRGPPR